MNAALEDTRRTVQGRLLNWALWAIRGNKIPLGYALQSWQRFVKCGQDDRRPLEAVDDADADTVQRCYVYIRQYHPVEAFAGKVFYVDNYDGRMTQDDMAKDMARKFTSPCSPRTFYRRKADFERLMARCLEG